MPSDSYIIYKMNVSIIKSFFSIIFLVLLQKLSFPLHETVSFRCIFNLTTYHKHFLNYFNQITFSLTHYEFYTYRIVSLFFMINKQYTLKLTFNLFIYLVNSIFFFYPEGRILIVICAAVY